MPTASGETRLIAAAMLAMPLIQKLAQGLETRVENGLAAFFAPTLPAATGQNVPSAARNSSAISAQAAASSSSAAATLLNLQNDLVQAHHHHGAGRYKLAASAASDLISQAGRGATTTATAVTA
jgi:hypothetical protein